jgi:hypothetical protein
MDDVSVTCACGRVMAPVASLGPGNYRCGTCRTRVNITSPLLSAEAGRCTWIADRRCDQARYRNTPLCRRHCQILATNMMVDPDMRMAMIDKTGESQFWGEAREKQRAMEQARRSRLEDARHFAQMTRPDCPTVYYVRLGEDHIKIGTSIHFPQRMNELRVVDHANILAVEPGGRDVEKRRHKQFDHLRYHIYREDFRAGRDLMEHIAAVRAEHGDPFELLTRLMEAARARLLAEEVARTL